jgi:hypothetical protein
MERPPADSGTATLGDSPESYLDALRAHPEWDDTRRDELLEQLIARFPAEHTMAAVRPRLGDLRGPDGDCLLQLVEVNASTDLLQALAEALVRQPELPPERVWVALEMLEGAGLLADTPVLAERWEELNEALDEDGGRSLEELADLIERDPGEAWLALEGLSAVEPEVRVEIVRGLALAPLGPGLIHFLRLLSFAHDPATRDAALEVLEAFGHGTPELSDAWHQIAADHPDPTVSAQARRWLSHEPATQGSASTAITRPQPQLVRSLVTALSGNGQGTVILSARLGSTRMTAAFLCDVRQGIRDVYGNVDAESDLAGDVFLDLARQVEHDAVADSHELALGLLGGSLLLCGPSTSPALRFWIEGTAGPGFRPAPIAPPFRDWDPASLPFAESTDRAEAIVASCPSWRDRSELTYQIAHELRLRHGDDPPEPARDAGAYRFLFEHHLGGELDLYRRMLLWMAAFWEASGDDDLGRGALALGWQLSDAAHAVPSHPFTRALITRSLAAAQADLRLREQSRTP